MQGLAEEEYALDVAFDGREGPVDGPGWGLGGFDTKLPSNK